MTMNERATTNDDARRLEQAADWAALLRDDAGEEDIVRWLCWCEADPRNQDAFDRVQSFWRVAGGLADEVEDGELHGAVERAQPRRARRRLPSFAVAASVLVAVVVAGALGWNLYERIYWPQVGGDAVVAATADPVRNAQLPDGSRIQLATRSTVEVNYSERQRFLKLRDGEAYFSVTHNPQRPFVVHIDGVRVRAVGTAFNIRKAGQRTVVTVTQGTVEVYRDGDDRQLRAVAGEQVAWENAPEDREARDTPARSPAPDSEIKVASVDISEVLAWREGRLEYTDEPLYAVIADFNRYSQRPVEIRGDAIRHLRFSGTLFTDVTKEWLYALPHLFPVTVRKQGDTYVIEPHSAGAATT